MTRRLVLLGAGHAHVEVLRDFARRAPPGAALTLVSPQAKVPYTGMIPGFIAGKYGFDDIAIDANGLARRAGAAIISSTALRIDRRERLVFCADGTVVPFDLCSINVGAVARNPLAISTGVEILTTKPVEPFIKKLNAMVAGATGLRVAVIGAGAGGIELAAALVRRGAAATLIAGAAGLAPAMSGYARALVRRLLQKRGVTVIDGADALAADAGCVVLADGRRVGADALILAAGISPPPVLASLDLPKDKEGFLALAPTLASPAEASIFAAGDCAAFSDAAGRRLPGAGVYAVRQAPVLAANLRAALAGAALTPYRPQKDYLAILSFWPDGAVAVRGRFCASGRLIDRWKEWIDRRFIVRYR